MIELALHKTLQGGGARLRLEFDATIAPRSLCAVIGPSGAGKTSLLRMIAGLSEPDGGRLVVNGETWFDAARGINLPVQQRSIGFVFQDYALFPNLSVRDNVAYGARRGDEDWVDALIDLTGLRELQRQRPATLSGGQKQRVALARALARRPALLLLDEPLSALDSSLRLQLQQELRALHERCQLTTLLVSHDRAEVCRLAHKVLALEQGRIVLAGTPAEVFLQQRPAAEFPSRARLLGMRADGAGMMLSLLFGNELIEVAAGSDEVAGMAIGDEISLALRPLRR